MIRLLLFVNKNGIRFQVDEALTVGESGYGYVKVRSINAGYSTNVPPNSITNVSPQPQGHIENVRMNIMLLEDVIVRMMKRLESVLRTI